MCYFKSDKYKHEWRKNHNITIIIYYNALEEFKYYTYRMKNDAIHDGYNLFHHHLNWFLFLDILVNCV